MGMAPNGLHRDPAGIGARRRSRFALSRGRRTHYSTRDHGATIVPCRATFLPFGLGLHMPDPQVWLIDSAPADQSINRSIDQSMDYWVDGSAACIAQD